MTTDPRRHAPWFGVLCLLPSGISALPAVLAHDPEPHAAATGWALLLALPAAVSLPFVLPRGLPRSALLWLAPIAVALVALLGDSATDTFELRRATLLLGLSIGAFLAGSTLDERAELFFRRGAVLLSLALTAQALASSATGGELGAGGPLGNSGVLSQAALPGAVLGALEAVSGPLPFRLLGGLAALGFALHAGTTPVLAGTLAFAIALVAAAALAPRAGRRVRRRAALFAAVAPLVLVAGRLLPATPGPSFAAEAPAESSASAGDTGGVEVRLRIWNRVPALVGEAPWTGAGPGQFRTRFPAHRDPAEIELSTHGRVAAEGVEVEHAHSDWLQAFAELGLPGGLAITLLFLLAGARALRGLRRAGRGAPPSPASCAAAIAILANSLVHVPLGFEPAPALLGWVVLGIALGDGVRVGGRIASGRWTGGLLAVLALAAIPTALGFVRHGALLAERQIAASEISRGAPSGVAGEVASADFWLEEGRLLRAALEAAPDSPLALSLSAAHFRAWRPTEATRRQARECYERVLAHRPFQVSAWIGLGLLANDPAVRREDWERALSIDPGQPVALENLARLELLEGDPARADQHLARLEREGRVDPELLRELGSRALLAGRTATGLSLLARLNPDFVAATPAELFAWSEEEQRLAGETLYANALEAAAHRLWGLEHLAAGDNGFAIAKFRQALRVTREYLSGGDAPTRLLLAAALELADRREEARAELEDSDHPTVRPEEWSALPDVAREALGRLGYSPPEPAGE